MSNQTTNDASVSELHDRLSELHEPSSATGQVPSSLTSPQPPQPQRPSQLPSQPQSPQRRKVWESDRQASECRRCGRRFNFLVRRHHCRRCGQIVCDKCSSHRVRLPADEIVEDPMVSTAHYTIIAMQPQRVCDACIRLPLKADPDTRSSHPLNIRNAMKRTSSSQSLMSECPVCGHDLLGMRKTDQERHLQQCLNTGSPPVHLPRYIVYKLSADSPQINEECPICFDEFQVGDKIARMVCLCSFHHQCLSDWLQRGRGCPVHYDASFAS
ncbi:FYVE zinc finger-domain-containing protein [Radiomyces spectabilis]|uniref:FYVE zinc finger-domain-containing protein n=1 Tax=Radiomyces spectabilis TaxID=64574 RepID=UPI00221EAC5E|nr:FYVE zinc finger-domain-containing protein [Radiomyces spectabilis]KAI8379567.1 FYVE zinc finger-domain-containing protein [Radiomyces spectabilis]